MSRRRDRLKKLIEQRRQRATTIVIRFKSRRAPEAAPGAAVTREAAPKAVVPVADGGSTQCPACGRGGL